MNTPESVIANDAIEFIRYGKEQTRWLSALMKAIRLDAEHNQGRGVSDLTSLGQHIAYDCCNYLDDHAEKLQSQIDSVGGEA